MSSVQHGRAVMRAYLNLRERPASGSRAVFDATLRAGAATSLAERIRRYGRLTYARLKTFANLAGIPESELRLVLMPLLRQCGLIRYSGEINEELEIIEQVAVAAPLLQQCDALWEACGSSPKEAAAVESAELGAIAPLALSDHQAL